MDVSLLIILVVTYVLFNFAFIAFDSNKSGVRLNLLLGLIFTRPNILGETFGFIQPLFWIFVYYFSSKQGVARSEKFEDIAETEKFRKSIITPIFVFYGAFWFYTIAVDLLRGNQIGLWVFLSNSIGLTSALVAITKMMSNFEVSLVSKVYCWFLLIPSVGSILKIVFPTIFQCADLNFQSLGGRSWNYSFCSSGAVFLGERFTGFGGEPAIFAVELALGVFVLLNMSIYSKARTWSAVAFLSAGVILSQASTGYVALGIAFFTTLLNFTQNRIRILSSIFFLGCSIPIYGFLTELVEKESESNPYSIRDRFMYNSPGGYFENWSSNFFGIENLETLRYSGINLLSLSLLYGVPIILFTLLFSISILVNLRSISPWNGPFLIIIFTMVFSQPPITNYLWFILLYLILGLQVKNDSYKKSR